MPEALGQTLHLSRNVVYLLGLLVLLLVAFAAGLTLERICKRWAAKLENTWGEVLFSVLQPLPIRSAVPAGCPVHGPGSAPAAAPV